MKTTNIILMAAVMLASPAMAQETYENTKIATEDLNGTARYVGMGGALEALGADISTMGTNPAGIGLMKHSTVSASAGVNFQGSGHDFADGNKTNASFDQIGGVWSLRTGRNSFLNFGFNYHKSRNLDYILNAAGTLNGAAVNKQAYMKGLIGDYRNGGFYVDTNTDGEYIGYEDAQSQYIAPTYSQVDYLLWNAFIPTPATDQDGNALTDGNGNRLYDFGYNDGSAYVFNRAHTGYIGEYDFNISGNVKDQVFLGLTFGLHDVHYNGYSEYTEYLVDANGNDAGSLTIADDRKITGTGFDVKFGAIFRPIETSPFRIGVYIHTPTWYDLTTRNYTTLANNTSYGSYDNGQSHESYDYKMFTPWKFGVSLGHTVGNYLALGATYEYADYGNTKSRINTDGYYDALDNYYTESENDKPMNRHTQRTLKGVSTLKLGAEYKPIHDLALRIGYNYVSPMFKKSGYKDSGIPSNGSFYASATDYTNWKATNRVTFGIGYTINKFTLDMAYLYSCQKGDFYPMTANMSVADGTVDANNNPNYVTNNIGPTEVKNNRHQLLLTLGYRF